MSKRVVSVVLLSVLSVVCGCNESRVRISYEQVRFSAKKPGVVKVMTFNIRVDTFLDVGNGWKSRKGLGQPGRYVGAVRILLARSPEAHIH